MTYFVTIKETNYATVQVEAESLEQAEQEALDIYEGGISCWDDCDVDFSVWTGNENSK